MLTIALVAVVLGGALSPGSLTLDSGVSASHEIGDFNRVEVLKPEPVPLLQAQNQGTLSGETSVIQRPSKSGVTPAKRVAAFWLIVPGH